jgi:hypothetical protein
MLIIITDTSAFTNRPSGCRKWKVTEVKGEADTSVMVAGDVSISSQ